MLSMKKIVRLKPWFKSSDITEIHSDLPRMVYESASLFPNGRREQPDVPMDLHGTRYGILCAWRSGIRIASEAAWQSREAERA